MTGWLKDSYMRCHYVPQFFLRNFSIPEKPGYVHAYQRSKEPLTTTINSVAAKNDLYVFSANAMIGGEKSNQLESIFSELENATKPIIERIIKTNRLDIKSAREFGILCEFFALLYARNLAFRESQKNLTTAAYKIHLQAIARDPERFREVLKRTMKGKNMDSPEEIERLRDAALNFDKYFKISYGKKNDDYFLKQSILIGNHLIDALADKNWNLLLTNNNFFISSDNPVTLVRPPGLPNFYGTGFKNGIVAIPISPKHCLWITNEHEHSYTAIAQSEGVAMVNKHIMFFAQKFVYSHTLSPIIERDFAATSDGAGQAVVIN
jgi:hypothetical protein